jgi:hypothetical protein
MSLKEQVEKALEKLEYSKFNKKNLKHVCI